MTPIVALCVSFLVLYFRWEYSLSGIPNSERRREILSSLPSESALLPNAGGSGPDKQDTRVRRHGVRRLRRRSVYHVAFHCNSGCLSFWGISDLVSLKSTGSSGSGDVCWVQSAPAFSAIFNVFLGSGKQTPARRWTTDYACSYYNDRYVFETFTSSRSPWSTSLP